MVDGGFFERPRHLDGELIDYARTSNVLIRHDVLQRHTPPFDPAYGLSGGEGTHFFMRAVLEGITHRLGRPGQSSPRPFQTNAFHGGGSWRGSTVAAVPCASAWGIFPTPGVAEPLTASSAYPRASSGQPLPLAGAGQGCFKLVERSP